MAIQTNTPISVTETRKVEETVTKTYDRFGIESIQFRWPDNNAGGRVSAIVRLRPYDGTTGELASPQASKTLNIPDLMAEAATNPALAAVIEQLFAIVGAKAVEKGIA